MTIEDFNQALNSSFGRNAFPDGCPIGTTVSGQVVEVDKVQQTDNNGAPRFFPKSGDPMYVYPITLQTDERDNEEDGGLRTAWAKDGKFTPVEGNGMAMLSAIREALGKVGAKQIEIGGKLTIRKSGLGEKKPGQSHPILFQAKYEAPVKAAITAAEEDGW